MYTIEKGVPHFENRGRRNAYPFKEMEIGDSFSFQYGKAKNVKVAAWRWGKQHGCKFSVMVKDGVGRCWRIE